MKPGPDIAFVASLVGDPARANMLTALMAGQALTATELAQHAGVTIQTASSHLAKLEKGGLVTPEKQGRHRYYRLTGADIAAALEELMGIAARAGHLRARTGPKDPALRHARVCYDHLAGEVGVAMFDSMLQRRLIVGAGPDLGLTPKGQRFCKELDIDLNMIRRSRRPLCKTCLDWSARRNHLAGALGAALLNRFCELKWVRRDPDSRVVSVTRRGEEQFGRLFGTTRR
jgi:DNA-binding transcriptional ArsR family regulator